MKTQKLIPQGIPLNILYADDDVDDHYFFDKVLQSMPFYTELTTVEDGEKLIAYLSVPGVTLPDVLFLDYNMPRKNGGECLVEIKKNPKFTNLPVIMYSTHLDEKVVDELFLNGAYYCIRKADLAELKSILQFIFTLILEKKIIKPERVGFMLGKTN